MLGKLDLLNKISNSNPLQKLLDSAIRYKEGFYISAAHLTASTITLPSSSFLVASKRE